MSSVKENPCRHVLIHVAVNLFCFSAKFDLKGQNCEEFPLRRVENINEMSLQFHSIVQIFIKFKPAVRSRCDSQLVSLLITLITIS